MDLWWRYGGCLSLLGVQRSNTLSPFRREMSLDLVIASPHVVWLFSL